MKLWNKLKNLFKKDPPALCKIDHFSGIRAICWVQIANDMAVKAVFDSQDLRHLMAGDHFYYDLKKKKVMGHKIGIDPTIPITRSTAGGNLT